MSEKVLHLIDHMRLGGAQEIICTLLDLDNHFAHSLRETENQIDCNQNYSCTNRASMFNLKCILDTYYRVKEEDITYIHCHMPFAKAVAILIKLNPRTDVEIVFHEHGTTYRYSAFFETCLKITNPLVAGHIAVSDKSKEILDNIGIEKEKIVVIRSFADKEKFSQSELEEFGLEIDSNESDYEFKVGFAGRIEDRKGWKTMVKLADILNHAEIFMGGVGSKSNVLKDKASIRDNLTYLGYIDDVRQLLNHVDCIVIPSLWDPCPLIFYECLAAGVPVVASNCNSIDEIAEDGHNSLLFEPGNANELAERIRRLETDEDLRQKLIEGGKKFSEKNDVSEYQNDIKSFYEQVST